MNRHFYLFLDTDGVLHPVDLRIRGMTLEEMKSTAAQSLGELQLLAGIRGFENASEEPALSRLPLLEQTIRPFLAQIDIVISSSWRLQKKALKQLLDGMSDDVRDRVVGVTPRKSRMNDTRADEIKAWLQEHAMPGVLAVVLDDQSCHGNRTNFAGLGIWIQIDPVKAFSDDHAARLTHILSRKEGSSICVQQSGAMPIHVEVRLKAGVHYVRAEDLPQGTRAAFVNYLQMNIATCPVVEGESGQLAYPQDLEFFLSVRGES